MEQHALRTTHRTWALAAGVAEALIDRQLGHVSPGADEARSAAWSVIGRKHYTDLGFLTLDARKSAEAVRSILDASEAEFQETACDGRKALLASDNARRVGTALEGDQWYQYWYHLPRKQTDTNKSIPVNPVSFLSYLERVMGIEPVISSVLL